LIQVEKVTKRYGTRTAVDGLTFTVERGEILGFLGPNGAGKSTTMNIITGYLSATEGTVRVDGHDVLEEPSETRRRIGYMPEQPPLYLDMTVGDYLAFAAAIKGVPRATRRQAVDRPMEMLQIAEVRGRLIRNLSKGYRQRVGIAQALVGSPPVLILDEPTIGLDPQQIIETRTLIRGLGREHTVILSSHILPEVQAVCDRILVINRGRIAGSGTAESLSRDVAAGNRLGLRVAGAAGPAMEVLRRVPRVVAVQDDGEREPGAVDLVVQAEEGADVRAAVSAALADARVALLGMRRLDPTLEEVFLRLISGEREEG
jgi:ABC-2 type transport system ATP-binding protein